MKTLLLTLMLAGSQAHAVGNMRFQRSEQSMVEQASVRCSEPRLTLTGNTLTLHCGGALAATFRAALGAGRSTPRASSVGGCTSQTEYYRAMPFSGNPIYRIHGLPADSNRRGAAWAQQVRAFHPGNWTLGCIALTNQEMDYLCAMTRGHSRIPLRVN